MMMFTFSVFNGKYRGKFGAKIQNCIFKVKFDTLLNRNTQNSMVVFILYALDWKHLLGKLGLKNKIVSLS